MTTAVERFLKYVSYDTQSDEAYDTCPSTKKQLLLANELKRELEEMGASDGADERVRILVCTHSG